MNENATMQFLKAMQPPSGSQPGASFELIEQAEARDVVRVDNVHLTLLGRGGLPSAFAVTEMASAAVSTAALALARLMSHQFGVFPGVLTDRRLASFWYETSLRPSGWQLPAARDPVTGDYQTRNGWIRIHANAPHHREAALAVL